MRSAPPAIGVEEKIIPAPSEKYTDLEVIDLGVVDYAEAIELQHRLVDERAKGLRPDTLILLEHPHVITRGRGYNGRTMKAGDISNPIFDIERGGDITYHGPGQLVGYPIIHLKERGILIGRYLRALEDILIDALRELEIDATRLKGFTGVWAQEKKIASIGVAVRSWVTFHGFALNVSTDLSQFKSIYPCGLEASQMISLKELLGSAPDPTDVRRRVIRLFTRYLNNC